MISQDIIKITEDSDSYPPLLREIHLPPRQLYIRGEVKLLSRQPMLTVVGSRKASAYGKDCVVQLLTRLVQAGVPLVSGLAYGIDAAAHRLCVDYHQPTIAVLGSGINDESIYPKVNIKLVHEILNGGGAVISEYEPGTVPYLGHFPARNRIIAGLTAATLVVQAARKSGSLITARLALESGRDVYAVPGPINDPLAVGTNQLIKDGAAAITSYNDLLELFGFTSASIGVERQLKLTESQKRIYDFISTKPIHVDVIAQATTFPASVLAAELLQMELAGVVSNVGGMKYIKKSGLAEFTYLP